MKKERETNQDQWTITRIATTPRINSAITAPGENDIRAPSGHLHYLRSCLQHIDVHSRWPVEESINIINHREREKGKKGKRERETERE